MESPTIPFNTRNRLVRDFSGDDVTSPYHARVTDPRPEQPHKSPSRMNSVDSRTSDVRTAYVRSSSSRNDVRSPQPRTSEPSDFGLESHDSNFRPPTSPGEMDSLRKLDFNLEPIDEKSSYTPSISSMSQHTQQTSHTGISGSSNSRMADFFGHEVFQTVLHNPTASHQLLRFSRSRLCGENMEFLEKVDRYYLLLNEVTKTIYEIHREFISVNAPEQINIAEGLLNKINKDLKSTLANTLPKMESVFVDAQNDIEKLVEMEIYPRFVRYQMTMSAVKALGSDRHKYAGLGDCFVLTDPAKADNPIVYASDGFVKVTGYTRNEIIPRNCRFLQGRHTDRSAVKRIRDGIHERKESVELLLNHKKNGEPFWNLLYTTPLFDSNGKVAFFLGGQINCSTTIHNASDILKILSYSEDIEQDKDKESIMSAPASQKNSRSSFFSAFRSQMQNKPAPTPRAVGMENNLLGKIENMDIKKQMDVFYTAYSKYLIVTCSTWLVSFYSTGIIELLYPSKAAQINMQVVGSDIFKFLSQHTSGKLGSDFKGRVKSALRMGQPISLDLTLCTRKYMGFEKYVVHWTPLKNEQGAVEFAVLTFGAVNA